VGTQANELEADIIRLTIDKNQIGADMTVAVIVPITGERMV
jgi:hypothetical protein